MLAVPFVPCYQYADLGSLVLVYQPSPGVYYHFYLRYGFHIVSELPF